MIPHKYTCIKDYLGKKLTVYRYPYRLPATRSQHGGKAADMPTDATDYLMIRRERFKYDDQKVPAFYDRSTPGNRQTVIAHPDRCYIAIPPQITTQYSPAYRRADVGVSGIAALGLMGEGKDFSQMADTLQNAAKSALPEFSTGAILSMINGFNQFVGLQGQLDINTIQSLQSGKIFNPYSEQIFQGMSFRTHNFAFKFLARNARESEEIKAIIDYIKIGSLPRIQAGDFNQKFINKNKKFDAYGKTKERDKTNIFDQDWFKTDAFSGNEGYAYQNRFFEIPDRFQLRFVRFGTDVSQLGGLEPSQRRDLMFKIYPSVCTGINVNYTPDNQYVSLKNPSEWTTDVPAVVMTITFTETRLLTQKDVAAGY